MTYVSSCPPAAQRNAHSRSSAPPFMSVRLYRLHYEILQFYQFMIPTEEEHAVRQQVINRITNVINQYLPTASVRL